MKDTPNNEKTSEQENLSSSSYSSSYSVDGDDSPSRSRSPSPSPSHDKPSSKHASISVSNEIIRDVDDIREIRLDTSMGNPFAIPGIIFPTDDEKHKTSTTESTTTTTTNTLPPPVEEQAPAPSPSPAPASPARAPPALATASIPNNQQTASYEPIPSPTPRHAEPAPSSAPQSKSILEESTALRAAPPAPHAPLKKPNIFARLTFHWVTSIVNKGRQHQLTMDDLRPLPENHRTDVCYQRFYEQYQKTDASGKVKNRKNLLFTTFKSMYAWTWFAALLLYVVSQLAFLANSLMLQAMISWIENLNEAAYIGPVLAAGMVAAPIVAAFTANHGVVLSMRISLKARVALNAAIYAKALRMSVSKDGASFGEVVDLLNNDSNRIINSFHEIIFGCIAPFQIIIITALIYVQIGPYAFVCIGTVFLLLLPNGLVAKKMHMSRKNMLGHTDERLRSIGEFVQGIRAIKCYVWESFFKGRIYHHRDLELYEIRRFAYLKSTLYFLMGVLPSMAALATFVAYVLSGNELTATKAFVTLSLINLIRFPLAYIPVAILNISANIVAFGRIQKFLDQAEAVIPKHGNRTEKVVISNADFNWIAQAVPPTLSDVNVEIQPNELAMIVGSVGSGKSTLLSAILGEVPIEKGDLEVNGNIAYVPQTAWILNASFKDNIIMGDPFDEERFYETTRVCALDSDITMLSAGIMTQIGEKGVNLSGGQQQRVSLARAVYSKKDILLLDDCLSAVDQRVAKHIFDHCINGYLRERTVVFITNHLHFVPGCDHMIVVKEGKVVAQFKKTDTTGDEMMRQLEVLGIREAIDEANADEKLKQSQSVQLANAAATGAPANAEVRVSSAAVKAAVASSSAPAANAPAPAPKPAMKADANSLVRDEERMSGAIPWSVYTGYVKTGGAPIFITVACFSALALFSHAAGDYWLSYWVTDRLGRTVDFYLIIFAMFAGVELVLQSVGSFTTVGFGIKACRTFHERMSNSLLNAKIGFFDANPLGRILNRFSRDQDMLDVGITERMYQFLAACLLIIVTIIILGLSSYYILIAVVPMGICYFFVQKFFRKASIELKRLEAVQKSPILAQMVESLAGVQSIRAFNMQSSFMNTFENRVDGMNNAYFHLMYATQWLGLVLDLLGIGIIIATVIVIVTSRDTINPGLVGLSIVYATSLRFGLTFSVLASTQTEISMNATERIMEYCNLPQEPADPPNPTPLPEVWPSVGNIEFTNVEVKYRPELPPVLRDINISIRPGEKIGIVGRTGAGKSTFASCLFRMVDLSAGRIIIDGVDIHNLPIDQLRSHLTILPQTPMLFMGTVRENLDPFSKHSDEELWEVLSVVQMKDIVSGFPDKLESQVDEGGENFSQGQRQLICFARALLQGSKVLLLDEAMANIDFYTESIIQQAVQVHLKDCTVLTIAHRIASIMQSDRVMVMDKGRLVEFDNPQVLLEREDSLFRRMVNTVVE
eukprot:TRINITY_DN2325_c0_g1_i1.p1 TRINITY_DN2325_c0_g1~~TRINITY_DN2325_c0_g1_i1.p1  ORF type:complete len:1459 (-),score=347.50 TRINITY_DN2325_c0_g1_i1:133-4509(-)